jgi:hypothetical protein
MCQFNFNPPPAADAYDPLSDGATAMDTSPMNLLYERQTRLRL